MSEIKTVIPLRLKNTVNPAELIGMGFENINGLYVLKRPIEDLRHKGWWWSSISIDTKINNMVQVSENSLDILFDLIQRGWIEKMDKQQVYTASKKLTEVLNNYE